jgi:hypothetical protein
LKKVVPAIAFWNFFLDPGLLGHFQKKDIGQLRDILMISDAVISEDITETP